MGAKEKLTIVVDATTDGATREIRKLDRELDKAGKTTDGFRGQMNRLGTWAKENKAALGAAVATFAVGIGKAAVDAASQLEEVRNQTDQLFGSWSSDLKDWADDAAENFGQSARAALSAANTFAVFGQSAGLIGGDLAGFSQGLTELASDMASFKDTSPEDAVQALAAALRGENEPIRRYGALLDEATVKNRALQMGLIKTSRDALTPQQKVLARQAELYDQLSFLTDDWDRTSGSLANQQRTLSGNIENLAADIGEKLLPVVTSAVDRFNSMLGLVEDLNLIDIGTRLDDFNLLGKLPTEYPGMVRDALNTVKDFFDGANFETTARVIPPPSEDFLKAQRAAMLYQWGRGELIDAAKALENYGDRAERTAENIERLADAQRKSREEAEKVADAYKAAADLVVDVDRAQRNATDALTEYRNRTYDATEQQLDALEATRLYTERTDDAFDAIRRAAEVSVELARKQAEAEGATLSGAQAQSIFNSSLLSSIATVDGPLRQSLINYVAQVNGIPEEKATELLANLDRASVSRASYELDRASAPRTAVIRAAVDLSDYYRARATLANDPRIRTAFAAGGVSKGGVALVGEQGPELVNLPAGSRVYPADETARMLNSTVRPLGGTTVNATVNVDARGATDPKAVGRAVADALASWVRSGNRIPSQWVAA